MCVCVCVCMCVLGERGLRLRTSRQCSACHFGLAHLRFFVTEESVALQLLVLMVTRDIAEHLIVVGIHSAIRYSTAVMGAYHVS